MSHVVFDETIDLLRPAFFARDLAFLKVDIEHGFEKRKQTSVQHAKQGEQPIRVLSLTSFFHRNCVGNHLLTRSQRPFVQIQIPRTKRLVFPDKSIFLPLERAQFFFLVGSQRLQNGFAKRTHVARVGNQRVVHLKRHEIRFPAATRVFVALRDQLFQKRGVFGNRVKIGIVERFASGFREDGGKSLDYVAFAKRDVELVSQGVL